MILNGHTYTDPSVAELTYSNVDKAERNANALMLIDGVALKRKYEFSWAYLSIAEAKQLMIDTTSVANRIIAVSFYDLLTDTYVSGNFYTGDKKVKITKLVANVAPYVRDISFNIIEQ
jgi:hypothetical protein